MAEVERARTVRASGVAEGPAEARARAEDTPPGSGTPGYFDGCPGYRTSPPTFSSTGRARPEARALRGRLGFGQAPRDPPSYRGGLAAEVPAQPIGELVLRKLARGEREDGDHELRIAGS